MKVTNRGQQELLKRTKAHGAARRLARKIGAAENQISQWARGVIPDGAHHHGPNRKKLAKAGYRMSWWDEPPVREEAQPEQTA